MKKVLLSVAAIGILTTGAFASKYSSLSNAKNLYIQADVGSYDMGNGSDTGYGGSIGWYKTFSNDWMFGLYADFVSVNMKDDYGQESSEMLATYGIDLGYEVLEDFTPYIKAGVQGFNDLSGFEYGIGAKYQITSYIAVDVRYSAGTLLVTAPGASDISTSSIQGGLEFNFRTK